MSISAVLNKSAIATVSAMLMILSSGSNARSASLSSFTNLAAFNQAATTTLVEDFEAFSPKDTLLPSFVSNGNTYTALAGTGPDGNPLPNVVVVSSTNSGFALPLPSSVLTSLGPEDFTIEFGIPTEAVAFDTFLNGLGPATVQVFGAEQLIDTVQQNHDPATIGFLGIVASEPIHSIRFTTVDGDVISTGIDNIRQGQANDANRVPEPGMMLGLGMFAIALSVLRKRRVSSQESFD